jgi:DNA repair exonuclease SbcCD ATPase subunit
MPDDDNNRSRSYAEYHASENVTKAFLRSWEFRSAQVMCLGAASAAGVAIVFALTGSFAIDNKKADIRDQLERRATEARQDIEKIVDRQAKIERDTQERLQREEQKIAKDRTALDEAIKKGSEDIKKAGDDFKKSEEALRKKVVDELVARLLAKLDDNRSDLMIEINNAKEKVTSAAKQAADLESRTNQVKPKLDQIDLVIRQSQGLDRVIASIEDKEKSARAAEAAAREARSAAELNQKSAATAEALTYATLGGLPNKVAQFAEDVAKVESGIQGLKDTVRNDQQLIQQKVDLVELGKHVGMLSTEVGTLKTNLEGLRAAVEALGKERNLPKPEPVAPAWPNCDVQPSESCKRLQEALNRKTNSHLAVDGYVGQMTRNAIKEFKTSIRSADVGANPYTLSDADKKLMFAP